MSGLCVTCEFFCSTPPNNGKCNITLQQAKPCDQYTPYIPRHSTSYEQLIDDLGIMVADRVCISCGSPLRIMVRGKKKYCAVCGCYLPEIVYGEQFREVTKLISPMEIPRPKPIPTVYSH